MATSTTTLEPTRGAVVPAGFDHILNLSGAWDRAMKSSNRALRTRTEYLAVLRAFDTFLADNGMPRSVTAIRREHLEAYLVAERERGMSDATVSMRFRALQAFWKWAVNTDEVPASPMARMARPKVPDADTVEFPSLNDVKAVLIACKGTTFSDRRDTAIIRLLFDTGARRTEVADLKVDDVDWAGQRIRVTLKGRRSHSYGFGDNTAQALRKYVLARRRHPMAAQEWLWLGPKGRLTDSGLYQVVVDRSRQARLRVPLKVHAFRHRFAHDWLADGGSESDLIRHMGWTPGSGARLILRYGAAMGKERAEAAYRKLGAPGDRLL